MKSRLLTRLSTRSVAMAPPLRHDRGTPLVPPAVGDEYTVVFPAGPGATASTLPTGTRAQAGATATCVACRAYRPRRQARHHRPDGDDRPAEDGPAAPAQRDVARLHQPVRRQQAGDLVEGAVADGNHVPPANARTAVSPPMAGRPCRQSADGRKPASARTATTRLQYAARVRAGNDDLTPKFIGFAALFGQTDAPGPCRMAARDAPPRACPPPEQSVPRSIISRSGAPDSRDLLTQRPACGRMSP